MIHRSSLPFCALATLQLLAAPVVGAQSLMSATLSGTIATVEGRPLLGALVTLTAVDAGPGGRETTTDASGRFSFALLTPGSYAVRAEAFGYRPLFALGIVVSGGDRQQIALSLAAAPPPVLTVDTVVIGARATSPWHAGELRLGASQLNDLPHRFQDLTSAAALASTSDLALGSFGLSASNALVIADGVPLYRAPHPLARAEWPGEPLLPRSALSGLTVARGAPDMERSGSAGSQLMASTRSRSGVSLGAAWSGDPLWSSSELDFSAPGLTSFRGSARADLEVSPQTAGITAGVEGFQEELPWSPRVDDATAATLVGLDPDLIASLSRPSVERVSSYSAFARGDVRRSDTSLMFLRGLVAYAKREYEGPGAMTLARAAAPPHESVDYSVAGGVTSRFRPTLDLELRIGISGSRRTFDAGVEGMPPARLVSSGRSLGVLEAGAGESIRTDFFMAPTVHYGVGGGTLKTGATTRFSRHTMSRDVPEAFLFSDGAALIAGRGFVQSLIGSEAAFSTSEVGAFVQYTFDAHPSTNVTFGARYDRERAPASEAELNTSWLGVSGLRSDGFPSSLGQLGASGAITWDPGLDGSTRLFGAVAVQHGDVDSRALHEALAHDVGATSTVFAGSGLVWPGVTLPGGAETLPTLTMLGPDTRAPRSLHTSLGLVRRLVDGWSVHVEGAFRRTDFLMRRRNLNLSATPLAVDAYGRDVFGTLQQDGALVTATASDARRFAGFHEVWALDPDGWSEYRGVTLALQSVAPGHWLHASYTRSEATDNWIGAATGDAVDAELSPLLPSGEAWSEGVSDYDATHRFTAAGSLTIRLATLSAVYRYRSGLPFTPGYRAGVDANGDGSPRNDVAFVDATLAGPLLADWPCLEDGVGDFAARNSCRGPAEHSLDLGLRIRIGSVSGREASVVLEGFDLVESADGVIDTALMLVDPAGSITTAPGAVTVPVTINPDFGRVIYPHSRGRMIRIGLRIG